MTETAQKTTDISIDQFSEQYGVLRIINPKADKAMVHSLEKYGQLTPVVVTRTGAAVKRRMIMNSSMALNDCVVAGPCHLPTFAPLSWN